MIDLRDILVVDSVRGRWGECGAVGIARVTVHTLNDVAAWCCPACSRMQEPPKNLGDGAVKGARR